MTPEEIGQRAKIVIADLEAQALSTSEKLKDMQASNTAAWDMYGSELCSGGMIAEEKHLLLLINKAKREIQLIKSFIESGLTEKDIDWKIKSNNNRISLEKDKIKESESIIRSLRDDSSTLQHITTLLRI